MKTIGAASRDSRSNKFVRVLLRKLWTRTCARDVTAIDHVENDSYPGILGCPTCGKTTAYLAINHSHWFVCDTHQVRWLAYESPFCSEVNDIHVNWQSYFHDIGNYTDVTAALRNNSNEDF
jgi:hypothetical protein